MSSFNVVMVVLVNMNRVPTMCRDVLRIILIHTQELLLAAPLPMHGVAATLLIRRSQESVQEGISFNVVMVVLVNMSRVKHMCRRLHTAQWIIPIHTQELLLAAPRMMRGVAANLLIRRSQESVPELTLNVVMVVLMNMNRVKHTLSPIKKLT